jgi:hypothetical protein
MNGSNARATTRTTSGSVKAPIQSADERYIELQRKLEALEKVHVDSKKTVRCGSLSPRQC